MEDQRDVFACRMGLLAAAVLHWVAAGIMLFGAGPSTDAWEFETRAKWHFASAAPHGGDGLNIVRLD